MKGVEENIPVNTHSLHVEIIVSSKLLVVEGTCICMYVKCPDVYLPIPWGVGWANIYI